MFVESENLRPLTSEELSETDAGQTLFYYIGFASGWFVHAYYDSQLEMTLATGSNMRR